MNNKKLAVDIAILPPLKIMEVIINLNKKAATKNMVWGPLEINDWMPHISLAMGGIMTNDLAEVKKIIDTITKKIKPITIKLNGFIYAIKENNERNYALSMKSNPELQKLHEELMNQLNLYFSYNCTVNNIFSKPGEEIQLSNFINNYRKLYSFINFTPHITLRTKKEVGAELLPIQFTVDTVVACQIGIHTTCRKKLFEAKLG